MEEWITEEIKIDVLLNHLGGYEDWEQGYFDSIPDDTEWEKIISEFHLKDAEIKIAIDGNSYTVR